MNMEKASRLLALVSLSILISTALTVAGCGGGEPEWLYTRNRYLQIFIRQPELTDRLVFSSQGGHRVISVTNPNRTLALVNVRLINDRTAIIPLKISSESAQLGDPRGERIFALDPFEASEATDVFDAEAVGMYSPFLWGKIELQKGFEVSGWMVFDIPKDLDLSMFWWNDPELASRPLGDG